MRARSGEISVGVIGAGGLGTGYAETLSARVPGARVAGVADLDRSRAGKLAAACGPDALVFESEQGLIRHDAAVDAVVITTPDETHAGLVLECLRHEKPVFCEKPPATTVEDARRIVEAEVELGREAVQVGFMRRYDPQHLDVKSAVDSGEISSPVLFKGTHRNLGSAPGSSSESILVNSAVHDLDSARWMLGRQIEEVYVHGTNTPAAPDREVLDLQVIQLKFSGGCLAGYGCEVGLEVVGSAGTVQIAPANVLTLRKQQCAGHLVEGDWLERFPDAYVLEMQCWVEDLCNGRLTGPDEWDGYASLLAAECCIVSLRSGKKETFESPRPPKPYR